jgi:hypothetical protein
MSERDACQGISVFEHGNGNDTRPFKYWLISVRCAHPSLEQTLAIAFMTVVTSVGVEKGLREIGSWWV